MSRTALRRALPRIPPSPSALAPSSGSSSPPPTETDRMEGLPSAPGPDDTLEPLRHLARLLGRQTARRLHRGLGGSIWLFATVLLFVALLLAAIMAIAPHLQHG